MVTHRVRLAHWAERMRERQESGQSVRAWCREKGVVEKTYYYWQRALREIACERLTEMQPGMSQNSVAGPGFTEVRMVERTVPPALPEATQQGQLRIEVRGIGITVDSEYPAEKLAELLRELTRTC